MKTRKATPLHWRMFLSLLLVLVCLQPMAFADPLENLPKAELEKQLESAEGAQKVRVLIALSEHIVSEETDQAKTYAEDALALAISLESLPLTVDARNQLGYVLIDLEDNEAAAEAFTSSYEEALLEDYNKGAGLAQNGLGRVNSVLGEHSLALSNYDKAEELLTEANYDVGVAFAKNNRGTTMEALGNYEEAQAEYLAALKIFEDHQRQVDILVTLNNIGSVSEKLGIVDLAMDYYNQSLELSRSLDKPAQTASVLNNIGVAYQNQDLDEQAMQYYEEAYELAVETDSFNLQSDILFNEASVYEARDDYNSALNNYKDALELYQRLGDQNGISAVFNNVGTAYANMGDYSSAIQQHTAALQIAFDLGYSDITLSALRNLSNDYESIGKPDVALQYLAAYTQYRDDLINEEGQRSAANSNTSYQTEKKEEEIEAQKTQLNLQSLRIRLITFILIIIGVGLIAVGMLSIWIYRERQKSEGLLLNILPKKVADDLKKQGTTEPERFQNVTVYFSDIVSFTSTSKNLEVKFLISELNDIFTTFDNIMEKYECERIKTIGDAYLAVSGMPVANENHAQNMIMAAMELRNALEARNETAEQTWRIRIGIHTGTVVGGVVGLKKYIYDVFGDTINTASRMESNGEPMRINVSGPTHEILQEQFPFIERELIEVKGKGKYPMFFLDHEKAWEIAHEQELVVPFPEEK